MALALSAIHELEMRKEYPAAIDALEDRLRTHPSEPETIIRLGFNLWYASEDHVCQEKGLPVEQYAKRFMELFSQHYGGLIDNADSCWAFGLGMQVFWYYFPGATEQMGQALLDRARQLDDFWARWGESGWSSELKTAKLKGRGIFERYYSHA